MNDALLGPVEVAGDSPDTEPEARGFVLVWMALLMLVLLALGGFAVDIGHWYYVANKEQKAADAAALAGAVKLPGDLAGASTDARNVVVQNGFSSAETTTALGGNPAQLKVTVTHTVTNFFTNLLGYKMQTLIRSATAEFQGPVPMGSPSNTFGNEPVGSTDVRWSNVYTSATQPLEWANVAGPKQLKSAGDAYQGQVCFGQGVTADDCTGTANNLDYKLNGYFFKVHVPAAAPGDKLQFQVFDPAHVDVGDHCNSNLTGANTVVNGVADAATRYAAGDGQFCTGDSGASGNPMTTTYVVRGPVTTEYDDSTVPVTASCTNGFPTQAGYSAGQFPGISGNLQPQLTTGSYATQVFRQWVNVCTLNNPAPGDYLIQVRSNIEPGGITTGMGDKTLSPPGHNRFSLRAGWVNSSTGVFDAAKSAGVTIAADGYMTQYANAPAATATFFLARVLPGSSGRTLHLDFFDIADSSDAAGNPLPGDLSLIQSDSGSTFSGCTGTRGPPTGAMPDCTIHGASSTSYNGKWVGIDLPIPNNYSCDPSVATNCWVQIKYSYGAGASVGDTTSWAASLKGDPVRLVK